MLLEFFIVFFMSILIDLLLGELPSFIHPVALMGRCIIIFKKKVLSSSPIKNRISGIFLPVVLIFIFGFSFIFLLMLSNFNHILFLIVSSILLSTTFAIKSLLKSVYDVYNKMKLDLDQGRLKLSFLVSRNTENLSLEDLVSAAIETLTENITDSVISPLTYIFIFGLLAIVFSSITIFNALYTNLLFNISFNKFFMQNYFPIVIAILAGVSYRVINTLDAMVGYKDEENIDIGWFSARVDDFLNYFPARFTGVLIVISSFLLRYNYRNSWKVMINDANNTPSPNSGYPMAAAAGALNVQLEKPGTYTLGEKYDDLTLEKIIEALKLTITTIAIYLIIILSIMVFIYLYFT
ncbi:MAG: cobalamin biosynthesis protein [Methanobacteriaceae archaeon]|nr:cobalamin biosynthesis protein [Methanobacteriaceae archaeon]